MSMLRPEITGKHTKKNSKNVRKQDTENQKILNTEI